LSKKSTGKAAEDAAARHLKANGYKILERNYSTPLGEIDIIAIDGSVLCFVEVRSHVSPEFGEALEALTRDKQRRVARMASAYMKAKRLEDLEIRFDFAAVEMPGELPVNVDLIKNAFWPGDD